MTDCLCQPAPDDETLAVAAQRGCRASFERLVARLQAPLLHFLERRCASREDAEDLVQEAFVRAFENLHRYRRSWRFSTWLFTIARRLEINQRRARQVFNRAADSAAKARPQAEGGEPAVQLIDAERRDILWQIAAALLSEPQWTALWLFYVEDLPVAEIARVLGRSQVGVKTMLFRARRALRPALVGLQAEENAAALPAARGARPHRKTESSSRLSKELSHVASAS